MKSCPRQALTRESCALILIEMLLNEDQPESRALRHAVAVTAAYDGCLSLLSARVGLVAAWLPRRIRALIWAAAWHLPTRPAVQALARALWCAFCWLRLNALAMYLAIQTVLCLHVSGRTTGIMMYLVTVRRSQCRSTRLRTASRNPSVGPVNRRKYITPDVDGDTVSFACDYRCDKFRRVIDKAASWSMRIRDEWNSAVIAYGCVRLVSEDNVPWTTQKRRGDRSSTKWKTTGQLDQCGMHSKSCSTSGTEGAQTQEIWTHASRRLLVFFCSRSRERECKRSHNGTLWCCH